MAIIHTEFLEKYFSKKKVQIIVIFSSLVLNFNKFVVGSSCELIDSLWLEGGKLVSSVYVELKKKKVQG